MPGLSRAKRWLIGRPLENDQLDHERLNKKTALAVLSSDAISSVAYATDQILFVLGGAIGLAALQYVFPISAVIVGLLVLVGVSYQQTIHAYPAAAARTRSRASTSASVPDLLPRPRCSPTTSSPSP